jgi:metal-responsive CopG/Arc/MetJ family transcriptional regulator
MLKLKKKERYTTYEDGMKRIKTSISIDEELWTEFCVKVVRTKGNRKLSDVLEEIISDYLNKD